MSTRDLIDAIQAGDSVAIEQAFQQEMANRIADRLDDMRVEVAKNMFNEAACSKMKKEEMTEEEDAEVDEELTLEDYSIEELEEFMVSEEFEQLDEISGKVLGSYIQKARAQDNAKREHGRELEAHPKVAAQSAKTSQYLKDKKYKQFHASIDKETAIKAKVDPNYPASVTPKRQAGIKKAIDKLQYGKMSD